MRRVSRLPGLALGMVCMLAGLSLQAQTKMPAAPQPTADAKQEVESGTLRERAWQILERGVHEDNRDKRAKAVRALGLLASDPAAVGMAETALSDKEPDVRAAAAHTLGEMRSVKSVPKLEAAAMDTDMSVALAAAQSLVALKNDAGYEVYYEVLTGERKSGVGMIQQQLDQLENPKKAMEFAFEQGIGFVPIAASAFEAFQMLTKKDPSPVRAAAATALAGDPDPRSGAALARALKDKNWIVRAAAVKAIALRNDRETLAEVNLATQDKVDEVRFAAAASVVKLTGK
jgi:HEAT repeat protein